MRCLPKLLSFMSELSAKRILPILIFLGAMFFLSIAVSLLCGPTKLHWSSPEGKFILLHIRLPRTALAFLVGFALSIAGACFQALLRNPLADPHFLGISAGGALGVVIGSGFVFSSSGALTVSACSLLGSAATVLIVYQFSLKKGALSLYTLLLAGVVLNSLFVSTIVFFQSLFRSEELVTVLTWLLGNFSFATPKQLFFAFIAIIFLSGIVFQSAKKLNVLALGESTAHTLGISVERTKQSVFFLGAALTGIAVSLGGMIGFIGLVVPHMARLLVGMDYRKLLPVSAILGGVVLVLADSLSRIILSPQELPVGVVTSFFGAPFFLYLLKQRQEK